MSNSPTRILTAQPQDIRQAAALLQDGQLVAFPTETVYGLGADARQGEAVAALYAAKGRPSFNPLIAHVHSIEAAKRHVIWTETANKLAEAFWPGPLTLVLPLRDGHDISHLVTAGLETLGVRIPAHPAARALLSALDGPVAAPSANPSGRISPTTAAHVVAGLDGRIAAIVDDGPCGVGVESTIVGLSGETPILLRPGGLAQEDIETVLGHPLQLRDASDPLTAPGQLLSHYAPRAKVRLNVTTPDPAELYLGFGTMSCDLNLSDSADLVEAAANLFGHLHQLDAMDKPIAVAPIPEHGLGAAINDRLRRAAAPR
ncbi:L-threonylcarbamoyladenylate synthase [Phaeobacter italicus]|uniref:L-threonylcarbamoyladenylate synthase n=1 Tax=Phaeobacter italicus TaxID=481446 RepID=UPI000186FCC3|nr:L-threonylcarbamoyladenylate synthase [Phaeobacter italicus]EEB71698.1 Sua5/YciO/YrdC family protein [Ruegeria sp. R11]CRL15325.1 t(6)A37 threonylcarbamoyladenosine biosynthesis protein RimN [Phaeobacter italicus]SFG57844.1 translation factor SUA5 [Phaeobacter italicus]